MLACYPGKNINGAHCSPLLRTTSLLKYILALSLEGTLRDSTDPRHLLDDVKTDVGSDVKRKLNIGNILTVSYFSMVNISCEFLNLTAPVNIHLLIQFTFVLTETVERLTSEEALLKMAKQDLTLANINFTARPAKEAYALSLVMTLHGYCQQSSHPHISESLSDIRTSLVSEIMVCRQVALSPDEYSLKLDTLELSVKHSSVELQHNKFLLMADGKVQLCLDDYLGIIEAYMTSVEDDAGEALAYTTLVCTAVSMTCLLLTFVTYQLFPTMRSVPGINNMNLVLAMFISQGLFEFGFLDTSILTLCISIGVFTHYFWLVTFACMSVCSFHMYKVFGTDTLVARSQNTRKLIALYLLFSYGAPALVVVTNVIVLYTISASGDEASGLNKIGYGSGVCFTTNRISYYVTFLAPILTICISNVYMFVRVAVTIRSTTKMEGKSSRRNDVLIYFKLFTITGVTWILVIVDSYLPMSVFDYIVTILTGCQDVFIFASFILNERVFSLYRMLCQERKRTPSTLFIPSSRAVATISTSL